MGKLNIQLCPETGICSLIKEDKTKIDMTPDEVAQLREAAGDAEKTKAILAQVDPGFTDTLDSEEMQQLGDEIK